MPWRCLVCVAVFLGVGGLSTYQVRMNSMCAQWQPVSQASLYRVIIESLLSELHTHTRTHTQTAFIKRENLLLFSPNHSLLIWKNWIRFDSLQHSHPAPSIFLDGMLGQDLCSDLKQHSSRLLHFIPPPHPWSPSIRAPLEKSCKSDISFGIQDSQHKRFQHSGTIETRSSSWLHYVQWYYEWIKFRTPFRNESLRRSVAQVLRRCLMYNLCIQIHILNQASQTLMYE